VSLCFKNIAMSLGKKAALVIFLVLLVDQLVKIWIKTHMVLGQEFKITDWFIIHFTENNGMAFGMELGGSAGKLILSVFRIIAIGAIGWYLTTLVKAKAHTGLVVSVSMILAGALGNVLDSAFYGLIFNESYYQVATAFSPDHYSSFLHGKVVDMLYFPLIQGHFPQWFPFAAGSEFEFFRPVFNLADSSITIGVSIILLFQKKFFKE
jgi:signal peptidase II